MYMTDIMEKIDTKDKLLDIYIYSKNSTITYNTSQINFLYLRTG